MAKNMILAGCLMMCLLEDFFVIATLKFVGHNVPSPPIRNRVKQNWCASWRLRLRESHFYYKIFLSVGGFFENLAHTKAFYKV